MQIERVSKQDRIYNFEHCIEHGPRERVNVWRWNVAGQFGYKSATYIKRCGYHHDKNLRNMRRPTLRTPDKCGYVPFERHYPGSPLLPLMLTVGRFVAQGEIVLAHCVPGPGKSCEKPATFNVWFEKCGGLYGFMCDEHVAKAIVDGVNGYRVYQITALNNNSQYPIPAPNTASTGQAASGSQSDDNSKAACR